LIYLLIDSGVLFEVATTIDEILGIVALKKKLRCYPEPRILPPFAGIIQIRYYECDLSLPFEKHLMKRTFIYN